MPARSLSSVDLPEPLGPINPTRSPARRSREMPVKSGRGPYAFLRSCELNRMVIVGMPLPRRGPARALLVVGWIFNPSALVGRIENPSYDKRVLASSFPLSERLDRA